MIIISGTVETVHYLQKSDIKTVADTKITVNNIEPVFTSNEEYRKKKIEISSKLYHVFSKY